MASVSHPIFARIFARLISPAIEREAGPLRDELLAGLSGRVLEIGAGTGVNFPHYPDTVSEVVACEPEAYLRRRASKAAGEEAVPIVVVDAAAEALPFPAASFDAVVAGLVLCSVRDPQRAVGELVRVLRPEGELRFLEHVRGAGARGRLQVAFDQSGVWPLVSGGCHCSRETVATLRSGGLEIERARELEIGPSFTVANPWVMGAARPLGARRGV